MSYTTKILNIIYIFRLLFLIACTSNHDRNKLVDVSYLNKTIVGSDSIQFDCKIVDSIKILVKLNVDVISKDSIFANITIKNIGYTKVNLYKPLLPSDSLSEDVFSVLNKNYNSIKFISPAAKKEYINDDTGLVKFIKPIIKKENFISILPNESLEFKTNLANLYEIKKIEPGTAIYVSYIASFPLIIDDKHCFSKDIYSKEKYVLIYFNLSNRVNRDEIERIEVIVK